MKTSALLLAIATLLVACSPSEQSESVAAADLIFVGDNIVTIDEAYPNASGVAVRGAEIVVVGSAEDALALRADSLHALSSWVNGRWCRGLSMPTDT